MCPLGLWIYFFYQHGLDWAIKALHLSIGWDPHYAAVARAHFSLAVHWFKKQWLISSLHLLNSTIVGFKYTFRFVNSHPQQPQSVRRKLLNESSSVIHITALCRYYYYLISVSPYTTPLLSSLPLNIIQIG